jgi:hypothetical protein
VLYWYGIFHNQSGQLPLMLNLFYICLCLVAYMYICKPTVVLLCCGCLTSRPWVCFIHILHLYTYIIYIILLQVVYIFIIRIFRVLEPNRHFTLRMVSDVCENTGSKNLVVCFLLHTHIIPLCNKLDIQYILITH